MTNNDILRRLRYTFHFGDDETIKLFNDGGIETSKAEISAWFKKDDQPDFKELSDQNLAAFLNGLIIKNRGKKEDQTPALETELNNNIIFRKLKIALAFKDEDVIDTLKAVNFHFGKGELNAFFRKANHPKYMECKDQVLRNFIQGLSIKLKK